MAEEVFIIERRLLGPLIIAGQDCLRHLAGEARRQADQPFVVGFEQFFVNPRFGVKAFEEAGRNHLDEVFVAGLVFAQQHQMVVAVDAVDLVKPAAGGHIDLAADDRPDAGRLGRIVKLDTAVHDAVVGDGHSILAKLLQTRKQPVDAAGAVEQAVFGMQVQVGKLSCLFSHCFPLGGRRQASGPPAGCV